MKPKIISVLVMFLLCISISGCSSNKSSSYQNNSSSPSSSKISNTSVPTSPSTNPMDTPTDSKTENTNTQMPSENKIHTISTKEILNILSTKNNEVIDSLSLSDSDIIKSINGERFYVPVFHCEKLGILIGFNGASFDSIDNVKIGDETPIFITPTNGTIISFDKNINFRVGDNIKEFKTKFGEGNASKEWNLKGDKQYCFLTYDINNLRISFRSLTGDDFKEYDVDITKLQYSPISNPTSSQTNGPVVSTAEAMEAYKSILQNKAEFFSTENKKNVYLNDFLNKPEIFETTFKATRFAVLDMDGDKIPEVVLELKYPNLVEVLHYMNGEVYGYIFSNRQLGGLKTDGTFRWSGGVSYNGYGKLRFQPNACETDRLGYLDSSNNNGSITTLYYINNKQVTEESYNSFVKEEDGKKNVDWYEFSQENIETKLSIGS